MAWPTINRCICGCSLRTSMFVWLSLSLIFAVLLMVSDIDYILNDSDYEYLLWFHIFQLWSTIMCTLVDLLCLYAICKRKPRLMLPFLCFSFLSLAIFIIVIVLLPIFWNSIINSKIFAEYVKELIIVNESRLTRDQKQLLYDKIRELIIRFALPIIEFFLILFFFLEMLFTTVAYSLYVEMSVMLEAYHIRHGRGDTPVTIESDETHPNNSSNSENSQSGEEQFTFTNEREHPITTVKRILSKN